MIQPEEIAQMAVAILQNDAMTGEVVVVDGGISLKTVWGTKFPTLPIWFPLSGMK